MCPGIVIGTALLGHDLIVVAYLRCSFDSSPEQHSEAFSVHKKLGT